MPLAFDLIEISPMVNAKINGKHGVTWSDVQDACRNRIDARWDRNAEGVLRLLVKGFAGPNSRKLLVVLFPGDVDGHWRLATAFPTR